MTSRQTRKYQTVKTEIKDRRRHSKKPMTEILFVTRKFKPHILTNQLNRLTRKEVIQSNQNCNRGT